MRHMFLAGVALVALTSVASAADLPRKSPPIQPIIAVPAFSWTGFYVGANAGYGIGTNTQSNSLVGRTPVAARIVGDPDGFIGGGQIGYNYQFQNNIVVGFEADFQGTTLETNRSNVFGTTAQGSLDYFGTARARVGYAFGGTNSLLDRTLLYVTGGFAYGNNTLSLANYRSPSSTQFGYVVGGGLEYAVTNNWTVKLEGLYVDLGRDNYTFTNANPVIPAVSTRNQLEFGVIRAGVNYKF